MITMKDRETPKTHLGVAAFKGQKCPNVNNRFKASSTRIGKRKTRKKCNGGELPGTGGGGSCKKKKKPGEGPQKNPSHSKMGILGVSEG